MQYDENSPPRTLHLAPPQIPVSWSRLRNVQKIYADGLIGLKGSLPASWSEMDSLEILYLAHAPGIRGELPASWGTGMPKLQQLRLEKCNIGGKIPGSWLTNMTELHLLTLNGNNLKGKVPTLPQSLFLPYNVTETTRHGGTKQTFTKQFKVGRAPFPFSSWPRPALPCPACPFKKLARDDATTILNQTTLQPAVLLHNNRLSCGMPYIEGHTTVGHDEHGHGKHSNVLIIPGNAFYGPAPDYTNE